VTLLPLIPSVRSRCRPFQREAHSGHRQICRFCGAIAAGRQTFFQDETDTNIVSCPLCYLIRNLDRPMIDRELSLVWMPELAQSALVALARGLHTIFFAHNQPADPSHEPIAATSELGAAWMALRAIQSRVKAVEERLGTQAPSDLAALFMACREAPEQRLLRLGGLRLFPLGYFHRGERDLYPDFLSASMTGQP